MALRAPKQQTIVHSPGKSIHLVYISTPFARQIGQQTQEKSDTKEGLKRKGKEEAPPPFFSQHSLKKGPLFREGYITNTQYHKDENLSLKGLELVLLYPKLRYL